MTISQRARERLSQGPANYTDLIRATGSESHNLRGIISDLKRTGQIVELGRSKPAIYVLTAKGKRLLIKNAGV
jgi:predicted transcriptional regulator